MRCEHVFVSELSTDRKGNIAEHAIALAATQLDIDVYRPVGEGGRYDLIFDLGSRLLRVQCKWAQQRGDVVAVVTGGYWFRLGADTCEPPMRRPRSTR